MGEAEVSGAGELEAGGDDGGVEVDDGAELDLDSELYGGGGECLAVEDPAAAVGERGGEGGKEAVALFITEALDVERLHGCRASAARLIAVRVFIGEWELSVRGPGGYCGHVTRRVWCCKDLLCGCGPVEILAIATDCVLFGGAAVGGWSCEVWHGAGFRDGSDGDQTGAGEHRPVWRAVS